MIISGHFIQNAIIEDVFIKKIAHKYSLYLSFKFSSDKNMKLPIFYINEQEVEILKEYLFSLFKTDSLTSLIGQKVSCLMSCDHILGFINSNFEIFSSAALLRKNESWVIQNLNNFPDILSTSFSLEKQINLSFFKYSLSGLEAPTSLDISVLKDVERVILKGKLESQLDYNDYNFKKHKI